MKVRHVDWYADEWIAGTIDLSLAERGMYITACSLIYSRGGAILTGILRSFCHEDLRTYTRCLQKLIDLGKLDLKDGYLSSKRCVSELERASKRQLSAEQNGAKGGRPSSDNKNLAKPGGSGNQKTNYQLPTTNSQEESPGGDSMPASAPPVVKKGAGNGRRKPRQAFPADWFPSERGIEFAHGHGRDDLWIAREGPRCRENHISKGNVFADLDAAWRTWVLGAERFDLGGGGSGSRSGGGGSGTSRIAAALNKVHLAPDLSGLH